MLVVRSSSRFVLCTVVECLNKTCIKIKELRRIDQLFLFTSGFFSPALQTETQIFFCLPWLKKLLDRAKEKGSTD